MKFAAGLTLVATLTAAGLAAPPDAKDVIKDGMGEVCFLRFSPSGAELVRICRFGEVEIFDVNGYDKIRTFSVGMRMVAFSADGTRIATAEGTDGARIWDAALPGKPIQVPPESPYKAVHVLDFPLKVLEAPYTGGANPRDVKTSVHWAEFSPDGKRLATTQGNGHVKVWDTATWAVEDDLALTKSQVRAAAFAPDGKTLMIGDVEGILYEWSFEKKAVVKTAHSKGAVMGIVFAPDGATLVTAHQHSSSGRTAVVWDADRNLVESKDSCASAAFSKDGRTLAFGGTRIELVDAATRKAIRVVELPELTMRETNPELLKSAGADADADRKVPMLVVALAFAPDGATLAAGCQDGTVRLVKTVSGR